MAITQYYVDYGAGNDTTGDGTVGTPWKTIQKALDTITRDSTNGDQINVKAGTAQVLAASLTLTTYGTPVESAPLIIRGYTATANDGGIGEIDANGSILLASAYNYIKLIHLKMHNGGNNNFVVAGAGCDMYGCEVYAGASTPSGKYLISAFVRVMGCRVYDAGTNGQAIRNVVLAAGNYIANCPIGVYNGDNNVCSQNIIAVPSGGTGVYCYSDNSVTSGNVIWSSVASNTGKGVDAGPTAGRMNALVLNNIICGFSGAGGAGVSGVSGAEIAILGYNAFYNNTTNNSLGDNVFLDLTANDVTLAADPFTDAANGDFSLTAAAKAALRSLGWPSSYLGVHANTDAHITIGPLQYGPTPAAAGGGFPILGGSVVR